MCIVVVSDFASYNTLNRHHSCLSHCDFSVGGYSIISCLPDDHSLMCVLFLIDLIKLFSLPLLRLAGFSVIHYELLQQLWCAMNTHFPSFCLVPI